MRASDQAGIVVDMAYLIRGIIVGFLIAAPVGPIGILCIRRTLALGRATGFVSGLGAATADATYGFVAAFGLTSVSTFLVNHQVWLRVVGGAFLCYLAYMIFMAPPVGHTAGPVESGGLMGAYASTLLLTITNPTTILSFAAIFAGLGLGTMRSDSGSSGLLVLGVFLGSGLWWAILSGVTGTLRSRLDVRSLRWVNRASALLIGGFGVAAILSVVR